MIRKSEDRQHNGQRKKNKEQSTEHTHKTKDHEPHKKSRMNSTTDTRRVNIVTTPMKGHE
jgi:hypothetical protein